MQPARSRPRSKSFSGSQVSPKPDASAFGQRLRQLRLERKLSQSDLVKRTGLALSSISRYEIGKSVPTPQRCADLASALGVHERDLLPLLTKPPETTEFGRTLRRLRQERGLTQQQLGERIGAQAGLISKYENRMNYYPSQRVLVGLVSALEVPEEELARLLPRRPETTPFGRELRDLRIQRKMTQKQLADRIQCGHGLIANYEIGRMQPGPKNLSAIARALRVPRRKLRALVAERGAEKHATAFGKVLRKARIASGMTQRQLARILRLRPGTITSYETANIYPAKKFVPGLISGLSTTLGLSPTMLKELLSMPRRTIPTRFGQRLRELRVARELTQEELASDIGYGGGLVSSYENGRTYPGPAILTALAKALEVEESEFTSLLPRLSSRPRPTRFGRELRRRRHERGLTQEQLAKHVDVGGVTIFNYEVGSTHPSLRVIAGLAKALGMSRRKLEQLLPEEPATTEFGRRIRQLRKQRELTQRQLAEKIGCKQPTISSYELGRKHPDPNDLNALAQVFGISRKQLQKWVRAGSSAPSRGDSASAGSSSSNGSKPARRKREP